MDWYGGQRKGKEEYVCVCESGIWYGRDVSKESVSVLEDGGWSAGVGVSVVREEWREA